MRRLALAVVAVTALGLAAPPASAEPVWVATLPLPPQGMDVLSAFPDGTAYVEHSNGGGNTLFRSTDYGRTWAPLAAPPSSGTTYVRFATPKVGYAVGLGDDRALRTADGGVTWRPVTPYPVPKGQRFTGASFAVSGRTLLVAGTLDKDGPAVGCEPSRGAVMVSNDEGRTWRRTPMPFAGGTMTAGWSVELLGSRDAAVVFYEEPTECATTFDATAVYVTHDGGRTFARRAACRVICTAVGLPSRERLLAGRVDGTTAISDDGGRTFREGQRFTDYSATGDTSHAFWVQAFAFAGRVGYASTKGGGTWRTTTGGTEWEQEVVTHESGFGIGIGEVAVFDTERAITGGPGFVSTRQGVATG